VLTERERQIVLLALHELYVTRAEFDDGTSVVPILRLSGEEIKDLALKFAGDLNALWFGANLLD
jgi:hypothetical protein